MFDFIVLLVMHVLSCPYPLPLCLLLHPLPLTASPLQLELPWDTPTSDCAEYREWCYQNYFFSPWTKISNEPLGKWEEGREGRGGEGREGEGREGEGREGEGREGKGTGEEDRRWVDSCMHAYCAHMHTYHE